MAHENATPRPWTVYEGPTQIDGPFRDGRTIVRKGEACTYAIVHTDFHTERLARGNAALIVEAVNTHDALIAERDRLAAENERLRSALEPFALLAEHDFEDGLPDSAGVYAWKAGDFRRALALLSQERPA